MPVSQHLPSFDTPQARDNSEDTAIRHHFTWGSCWR